MSLIICNLGLCGDALSGLPAIRAMADKLLSHNEKLYVAHTNPEVLKLSPHQAAFISINEIQNLGAVENLDSTRIDVMSASKSWSAGISSLHMAQAHFKYLGLKVPSMDELDESLEFEKLPVKSFDFIISPYSRSDHLNNKVWPYERWAVIINWLQEKGYKDIAVLRGNIKEEPAVFKDVTYIDEQPLAVVCAYLANVKKGLLSCDNGISHMARILKIPHFLLYPECLPPQWVANPRAITLRGEPLYVMPEIVAAKIEQLF